MIEAHTMEAKYMAGIIERLEAASGADRELDHAIFDATNERAAERDGRQLLPWIHCYTSSIDSALSLVPEEESSNFEVSLEQSKRQKRTYWDATIGHMHFDAWTGRAPTPAIALCIAALKARARAHKE